MQQCSPISLSLSLSVFAILVSCADLKPRETNANFATRKEVIVNPAGQLQDQRALTAPASEHTAAASAELGEEVNGALTELHSHADDAFKTADKVIQRYDAGKEADVSGFSVLKCEACATHNLTGKVAGRVYAESEVGKIQNAECKKQDGKLFTCAETTIAGTILEAPGDTGCWTSEPMYYCDFLTSLGAPPRPL